MIFGMNLCTYMKVQRTFCSAIPDGFWRSGSWKNYNKQKYVDFYNDLKLYFLVHASSYNADLDLENMDVHTSE